MLAQDVFEHGPDPDNPGWNHWNLKDETLFNGAVMGKLITRVDDDGKARLRIIHGAVTLSLIDIALFTTMHTLGSGNAGPSVTLELSTQFVGGGKARTPLDAVTEVVKETGKLVFVRGLVEQGEHRVASFSGIVRKMRASSGTGPNAS